MNYGNVHSHLLILMTDDLKRIIFHMTTIYIKCTHICTVC